MFTVDQAWSIKARTTCISLNIQMRATKRATLVALLQRILLISIVPVQAHSRWKCPEPRSSSTAIKSGPCGDDANDFSNELLLEIKPGPLRVVFEESVHHTGAPFRISLSDDGSDDSSCVLLDHIPHNDCCAPSYTDESTYTPYVITLNIPNVVCEKCSLHLSNPMTDKIGDDGSPSGIGCTDPGSCFSVYHSCTKPFRIVGSVDDGAVPRSQYNCNNESASNDWPQVWAGDNGEAVNADTPGLYRRESSVWSDTDFTLTTVPAWYTQDAGDACGVKVQTPVSTPSENNTADKSNEAAAESIDIVAPPSSPAGTILPLDLVPCQVAMAFLLLTFQHYF